MKMSCKQVILVREDLDMTAGKVAAQVAHAGMLFILNAIFEAQNDGHRDVPIKHYFSSNEWKWMFAEKYNTDNWEYGGIKKVVLSVFDLNHLTMLTTRARRKGLKVNRVWDEGLDCVTCAAIGPDNEDLIDTITANLNLYPT